MDSLDDLIKQRIKERQRKLDFIKSKSSSENNNKRRFKNKIIYAVLSAVACIVLFFLFTPMQYSSSDISDMHIAPPCFEEYRCGRNDSICVYLNEERYQEAMPMIDKALKEYYNEIEALSKSDNPSEETEYLIQLERDFLSETMWSKIYVLVKTNQQEGLAKVITDYLEIQNNQVHKEEASKILRTIQ